MRNSGGASAGAATTTAVLTALWLVLTWPLQPVGRNAGGGH